ncbi:MAG: NAD(P)/FAD-dependent oxidoreductase [Burkholderiales bacterium]|nr:NAD(P)/FAD-dependent oxidoreductase [Burkholderiales bacterium]MCA3230357.1 NAD(P)/FAD-dependent oxidoreductase [Burkholderiales bacterium]
MTSSLRPEHHVAVVGAGIGGLTAALLLASRGLHVTLIERAATPGGKMRHVWVDGRPVDSGPTVFTLRWIFDQIFAAAGTSVEAELALTPLPVLARHHWDGQAQSLDLHADAARNLDAVGRLAGAAEARRFAAFCAEAQRLYRTLEAPYIRSDRPTFWQMVGDLGPRGLATLAALGPFATLWRRLAHHFTDVRLQQLFGRYATYCGASPWAAPATLMLVAQVELDGVWTVDGGMHAVAATLAQLAQRRGARLRYDTHVREIVVRDGRARALRLVDAQGEEEELPADSIVFNGDAAALSQGLLGDGVRRAAPAVRPHERSLSAVTWSMVAQADGLPLLPHNVFFQDDYAGEFRDIAAGRLPARGTVYLCAQDRDTAATLRASVAAERMLCLVNAPAVGDAPAGPHPSALDAAEIERCEQNHFALLRRCGLTLTPVARTVTTPREFHRLFPGTGGAIYGRGFADRMTGGWMTLFKRSGARTPVPGLYLAGGSVHPGPGVPMAAMSGQLAAATLLAHLDSTSRSRRVVISGGTSTPSAMTAGTA